MIRLQNLAKYYTSEGNVVQALKEINLTIQEKTFVAITGESGSGKSTLLNVLSGMDTYEEGEYFFNKEETSYYDQEDWENFRRNKVGFVFQNYNLIDSYSVLENIKAALVIAGVSRKEQRKRAMELLEKVGLASHYKQKASKLSGGEKQRLSIARALAKDVPIIFADEPTGNLDSTNSKQIVELFAEIAKEKTVIVVTHDYDSVAEHVEHKVRLFNGEIVENKILHKRKAVSHKEDQEAVVEENLLVVEEPSTRSRFKSVAPLAAYNVKNQPKKSILLMFVAFFATFFISFLYMSYLNMSNFSEGSFDNFYFRNSGADRIVVRSADDEPFTPQAITTLSRLAGVKLILPYDLVYGQNVQIYSNSEVRFGSMAYGPLRSTKQIKETDLLFGRLPSAPHEIVITQGYSMDNPQTYIGHGVRMSLESYTNFRYNCFLYHNQNLEIVGIMPSAGYYSYVYVEDSILDYFQQQLLFSYSDRSLAISYENQGVETIQDTSFIFAVDNTLLDGQSRIHFYSWYAYGLDTETFLSATVTRNEEILDIGAITLDKQDDILDYSCTAEGFTIYVNYATFQELMQEEFPQLTIITHSTQDVDRTLQQLHNLGYSAFSPNNTRIFDFLDIGSLILGIFSIIYLGISMFILYILIYLIIKTILKTKISESNILRSIGFKSMEIKIINILELLIIFVVGTLLAQLVIAILIHQVPFFKEIYYLLRWQHYVVLFAINIAITTTVSLRYHKLLQEKSVFIQMKAK